MQSWEQDVPVTAENAGWRLHVRVERETLSRLPRSRAILFTIRTHIHRLEHYGQHPEQVRPAVWLPRGLRHSFEVMLCCSAQHLRLPCCAEIVAWLAQC